MSAHALTIGGTGMLAAATRTLASRTERITVVARRPERLDLSGTGATVHPLPLDWRRPDALLAEVHASIATHGPVSSALLWIHASGATVVPPLLGLLAETSPAARVVQVVGSAGGDPGVDRVARRRALLEEAATPDLDLRVAILGFAGPPGRTRWLTHEEISAGVLDVLDGEETIGVVGRVEPWEERAGGG